MDRIDQKKKYLYIVLFIMTINVFLSLVYYNESLTNTLFINLLFILIYSVVMYVALKEKNENMQFKIQTKALMENLSDYEKMLDHQRVSNHENKNQLLVVKNMVKNNEQGVVEYIDEIIKDKRQDNDLLYNKAKKIPSGGLQGIVYQKMLLMEELKIKFALSVNKSIDKLNLENLNSKVNYDICRILGIFLDNAIDEVKNLKEKEIELQFYGEDGYLIIETSNIFETVPDIAKLDDLGYSTKGEGHGYGLPLVKEITEKNSNITNERNIIGNVFTQIVKIKM